jgi:hypothetical protein
LICQRLIKNAFIAVALHIELQTFEFYAGFIGAILDCYFAEVGLGGFGADAGKFGAADGNTIITLWGGVIEQFQLGLFAHFLVLAKAFQLV